MLKYLEWSKPPKFPHVKLIWRGLEPPKTPQTYLERQLCLQKDSMRCIWTTYTWLSCDTVFPLMYVCHFGNIMYVIIVKRNKIELNWIELNYIASIQDQTLKKKVLIILFWIQHGFLSGCLFALQLNSVPSKKIPKFVFAVKRGYSFLFYHVKLGILWPFLILHTCILAWRLSKTWANMIV